MKLTSYILEIAGWALVAFTIAWTIYTAFFLWNDNTTTEPELVMSVARVVSTLGYLLEGIILGLIAVIVARLGRHAGAKAFGTLAKNMISNARSWEENLDD